MATVLIADDVAAVRRLLRLTLDRRHDVLEAADGAEALALLRSHRPDVAILDVIMPGVSGVEVCREMRADPALRRVGVLLISANANADDARLAGADRFVAKPFLPSTLLAAVDDVVRNRSSGD